MKDFFSKVSIHNLLAIICVIGVFVLVGLLCFKPIPTTNIDVVHMALGQLLALGFGVVIGYYFVASRKQTIDPTKTDES